MKASTATSSPSPTSQWHLSPLPRLPLGFSSLKRLLSSSPRMFSSLFAMLSHVFVLPLVSSTLSLVSRLSTSLVISVYICMYISGIFSWFVPKVLRNRYHIINGEGHPMATSPKAAPD